MTLTTTEGLINHLGLAIVGSNQGPFGRLNCGNLLVRGSMKRVTIFAKGNVDIHDSLHSCRVGGKLLWNGINEVLRSRGIAAVVRLKHETWTRSDALLATPGVVPPEISDRNLALGYYSAESQFSSAIFSCDADAIILSALPDFATELVRHHRTGILLYPNDAHRWPENDRNWLRDEFSERASLEVDAAMAHLGRLIERLQTSLDVPILLYNVSSFVPGETVHCLQGMGEIFATRARRFNLGIAALSEQTGISVIDVDAIIGRAGADKFKLDAIHLTPEGYRLVAEEVVRVLCDLGVAGFEDYDNG